MVNGLGFVLELWSGLNLRVMVCALAYSHG